MRPDDGMLAEAACEVLETMFFTTPLEGDDTAAPRDARRICATVAYHGARTGRFTACLAEPAARELAETFLCADNPPGITAVSEVAGELANMVCGSVLGRLEPQAIVELSIEAAGRCPGGHTATLHRTLPLSGGTLELYLEE